MPARDVMAMGAYGDGASHLVGDDGALSAAQLAFPLTHAAFTITAEDEQDWCAIQEAILTGGTVADIGVENVYIPPGWYKVNRTLTVPLVDGNGRTMTISGGGQRGNATSGTLIGATTNIAIFHIPGLTTIHNLALLGYEPSNPDSIGIKIGGMVAEGDPWDNANALHVIIDSVRFGSGFHDCIHARYECDQLKIAHCSAFGAVGRAVVYHANDHAANDISPTANLVIESCHFAQTGSKTSGNHLYGVYLMGTENSAIRNSVIRGYDNCIYLSGKTGVRNDGLVIEGIHSEPCQELKLHLSKRWTPNATYVAGNLVRPARAGANGWWYKCTSTGTSAANSIRSADYRWIKSAKGTGEYYCEMADGGDPSLAQPFGVMVAGMPYTFNFPGGLSACQWGYGNNDHLSYNTIYICLTGGDDPNKEADHSIWTTSDEPTWPTNYGETITDGTVTWMAYKRSIVIAVGASNSSINGGLMVRSVWCDGFVSFIHMEQSGRHDTARIAVDGCTVRNCDMVYANMVAYRSAINFENSQLEGCIRPFAMPHATNNQAQVAIRFCGRSGDYIGALGAGHKGVASWMTNEPTYSFDSDEQVNVTDYQVDVRNDSQITVSTGNGITGVTVTMPAIIGAAFQTGLKGKTITVTHAAGNDGLLVVFPAIQPVLTNDANATSLYLPDIGDSVTLRFGAIHGGVVRWFIVGSHGI